MFATSDTTSSTNSASGLRATVSYTWHEQQQGGNRSSAMETHVAGWYREVPDGVYDIIVDDLPMQSTTDWVRSDYTSQYPQDPVWGVRSEAKRRQQPVPKPARLRHRPRISRTASRSSGRGDRNADTSGGLHPESHSASSSLHDHDDPSKQQPLSGISGSTSASASQYRTAYPEQPRTQRSQGYEEHDELQAPLNSVQFQHTQIQQPTAYSDHDATETAHVDSHEGGSMSMYQQREPMQMDHSQDAQQPTASCRSANDSGRAIKGRPASRDTRNATQTVTCSSAGHKRATSQESRCSSRGSEYTGHAHETPATQATTRCHSTGTTTGSSHCQPVPQSPQISNYSRDSGYASDANRAPSVSSQANSPRMNARSIGGRRRSRQGDSVHDRTRPPIALDRAEARMKRQRKKSSRSTRSTSSGNDSGFQSS
ncbi:hypothetical protein BJ170DRAFT_137177 [Xylariales sp. AK1849]|nr:hypothetical protein BJ170DRAFT_137177 [Xylariales sp. AK1849]